MESQQSRPLPSSLTSPPTDIPPQSPSDQSQDAVIPPPPASSFQPPQENTESESSAPDRPPTTSTPEGRQAETNNDVRVANNQTQEVNDPDAMDITPINPDEQQPGVPVAVPVAAQGQDPDPSNQQQDTMETDPPVNGVNGVSITADAEGTPQETPVQNENVPEARTAADPTEEQSPEEPVATPQAPTTSQGTTENDAGESSERSQEEEEEEDDSQDKQDEDENEEPAYWADIEEDTSVPDEAELKEIESNGNDHSATECWYHSKSFPCLVLTFLLCQINTGKARSLTT